jgi:hypothetical protein
MCQLHLKFVSDLHHDAIFSRVASRQTSVLEDILIVLVTLVARAR